MTTKVDPVLTREDVDQIIEGIEHFIIGMDDDPELREIWQPYIDKLNALNVTPTDRRAQHRKVTT